MEQNMIRVEQLSKCYKGRRVLNAVSVTIQKGKIYGLIGPNGAGKTTLMRILTGGCRQSDGKIFLYSNEEAKAATERDLEKFRQSMGSLIEEPALYGNFSGWDNLYLHGKVCGNTNKEYLRELLVTVGLDQTGNKKVKNFSLGMKQRLGIAKVLVNRPDILILDEPINGLDPLGIIKVRNLLREINEKYNTTIIVSSHILSELDQFVDEYIFIPLSSGPSGCDCADIWRLPRGSDTSQPDAGCLTDRGKVTELIGHENLKNQIEANHKLNNPVSGEISTLEDYFIKPIGEGREKNVEVNQSRIF